MSAQNSNRYTNGLPGQRLDILVSTKLRAILGVLLLLTFILSAKAEQNLQRPDLVYSTKTRVPKIAGVPPLVSLPGSPAVYYRKLSFQGERHDAKGPYAPDNSYASVVEQSKAKLSGERVYSYDAASDSILMVNTGLYQSGSVNTPPPWDAQEGPFGAPPVLTVDVPFTYASIINPAGNNPMNLPVVDATHAAEDNIFKSWSNTQALYGLYSALEWQHNFQMELSLTDSPEQAEQRARVTMVLDEQKPDNRYTIRQTSAIGTSWIIREVNVAFSFPCSCSGLYEMVRKLERRAVGSQTWSFYKEERESREVNQGDWNGEFDLPLESGFEVRLADITFEKKSGDCAGSACGPDAVAGIGPGPKHGSISWDMPLGKGSDGRAVGVLSLYAKAISPDLYTPSLLTAALSPSEGTILTDSNNFIRQVLVPQALVDVVVTGSESYEIRVYDRSAAGTPGMGGIYSPTGNPYIVWRVENPGGTGRWRMIRLLGNVPEVTLVDESVPGTRFFSEADGLRVTETQFSTEGSDRVETVTVKDAHGAVALKRRDYFRTFNLGEQKVKEVLDPDGAALTTIWTYSTANNQTYQKLLSIRHPNGYLEQMTYSNESGILLQHNYTDMRLTKVAESNRTVSDLNGDGIVDLKFWGRDGFLFGGTHSEWYKIEWGGTITVEGIVYRTKDSIRLVSPGSSWNAPGNLVTKERYFVGGTHDGELAYRRNPDGTGLMISHSTWANGVSMIAEEHGVMASGNDSIIDGTRSVRTLSAKGFLVSNVVTDIASGLTISMETVGQTDAFGRPTEIQHIDGAIETRGYCLGCGAVNHTNLRGETVDTEYDALRRKVLEIRRAGTTVLSKTRTEYDAVGRLTRVWRVNPEDLSETLTASNVYDVAGRVVSTTTLADGTTNYQYAFGTGNTSTVTTINREGGARIETRDAGGRVYKVAGSAAVPVEYVWSGTGLYGSGYFASTRHYNDQSNFATETNAVNLLGNVYETTVADGTKAYRYYDTIGRLVRTVDQDGVALLYGYDAQGRQAISAIDLNANGTIDYNGADRITRTLSEVGTRDGYTVQRTTTQAWEENGNSTPAVISISEHSVDGRRSWQTVRGLTTSTTLSYDGSGGRTITTVTPDGSNYTQTFLGDRLMSTVTSHPSLGTLASVTNTYNALGQLASTTDSRNGTTSYVYATDDRLQSVTTPDPEVTRAGEGYDPQTTTYGYDSMGRVTQISQPDGGTVYTTYDLSGNVKRTWGSRTYPVEYTYDIQNRLKTMTTWQNFAGDAGKAVTTWNYNPNRGWLDNKRYADNTGPSYLYKASGRLLRRTWARGVQATYAYNAAGDLSGIDYADATPDVSFGYDRAGRLATISDGSGTRTLVYDASGQLKDEDYTAGSFNPLGVHRDYDSLSRLSSISTVNGSSLTAYAYSYDPASRLHTVTSGLNTATYGYLAGSPLVGSVVFKQNGVTRLTTTKSYDSLNRLSAISHVSSGSPETSVAYGYNSANQRTKATREDRAHWDYAYDALGQVTSGKKYDAANSVIPGHDYAWAYDDIGNRLSASRQASTSTPAIEEYTPTLLNQYAQRTVPGRFDLLAAALPGSTVTYQYPASDSTLHPLPIYGDLRYTQLTADNSAGNVQTDVKITGVKNNVGPNGEDAVTEITRGVFLPKTPEQFAYDADGNLTSDSKWSYTWNGENRLIRMESNPSALKPSISGGLLAKYYNYTSGTVWSGLPALERVESVDFDWSTASPGPGVGADKFNVLWSGAVEAPISGDYVFETQSDDGAQLVLNGTLIINNWGLRSGVSTMVSAPIHLDAGQRYPIELYYFNDSGPATIRLRWRKPGDAVTQAVPSTQLLRRSPDQINRRLEFVYDGQGRRVEKKVSEEKNAVWMVQETTRYLYDGWNLLSELRLNPSTSTYDLNSSYVWGLDLSGSMQGAGGVGGLLFANLQLQTSTSSHAPTWDGNGNVIGLVDMATGTQSATYEYDAFGEIIISDGPAAAANPFRFSTKFTDSETGLLYYGLRSYGPGAGRWLSRDPIEERGGINLYGMVGNNPITSIDVMGLWKLGVHKQITQEAFLGLSCSTCCDKEELLKGLKDGSIDPDIPDGFVGTGLFFIDVESGLFSDEEIKKQYGNWKSYRSHYGDLQWWHAMQSNESNATEIQQKIIGSTLDRAFAYKVNSDEGDCEAAGRVLGFALHTIEDSYSKSHVLRNGDWSINRFQNYSQQNSHKHGEADKEKGSVEYQKAVEAVRKLLNIIICQNGDPAAIRQLLQNEVLLLSPNASVGGTNPSYQK